MVRKTGVLAGIIGFLVAIISRIPIYPPLNLELNFSIFSVNHIDYYFWGSVADGITSFSSMNLGFPENLISIIMWCLILFVSISSIAASTNNTKYAYASKLYKLNILFTGFFMIFYLINAIFSIIHDLRLIFIVLRLGFYSTIGIMVLNIIALTYLRKSI
ncbi:MAG: hypothetical protein GF317_09160 [Candidatus Lokiarchaeota archaeon]|nr:hypothetical protein [Candidatus Lokiarchaeota archaeon]MBD3199879.1 hypothetical protein [Candidatus Lokiarchaeota archaeon]